MRWPNSLKVILMVFTLPSHLVTTSLRQWISVLLKVFCHLLGLSFLAIFLFLQLECLLSHNSKVNGHQVCPHRCENTESPVCLFWIILLPVQLGRHSYSLWSFGIVLALACFLIHTRGCAGSETNGGGMHVVSLQSAKKKKEVARFCYHRGFIRMKWVSAAPIWPGCVLASCLPVTTLEHS